MIIRTIIFDLGNVVLTNDWHYDCPEKFKEYSEYFGITKLHMERGWNSFWPEFKAGKISENEFWKGFLKKAGAKKIDVKHAKKLYRKYQMPIENMLLLLKKLKRHYKLGALTTISKEWLNYKVKKYKLNSYFDVIVSSGYSGIYKPNPKIYRLILKKLNAKPKETLLIDDARICLLPAKLLGMKTILYKNQKDLERKLLASGIRL